MIKVLIYKDPRYPLDLRAIRERARVILKTFGLKNDVELSLAFIGSRKAKQLNEIYRRMTYYPEVLSFPLEEARSKDGYLRLGDVAVCFPLARERARKENRLLIDVFGELLEHGIRNLVNP